MDSNVKELEQKTKAELIKMVAEMGDTIKNLDNAKKELEGRVASMKQTHKPKQPEPVKVDKLASGTTVTYY